MFMRLIEMKCRFCGNDLLDNDNLCKKCNSYNYDGVIESNQLNEEELLKLYARKDSIKIFYQKWSWPAFLFGPLYFWYRKMMLSGFVFYFAFLAVNYFIEISWIVIILNILLSIIAGLCFSSLYLQKARDDLKKIHENNDNLEVIKKKCESKGRVSDAVIIILGVIIGLSIIFAPIIIFIYVFWLIFDTLAR